MQESDQLSLPFDKARVVDEVEDKKRKEGTISIATLKCTLAFEIASTQIENNEI